MNGTTRANTRDVFPSHERFNNTPHSRGSTPLQAMRRPTTVDDENASEMSTNTASDDPWYRRSVATPQPNYLSIARRQRCGDQDAASANTVCPSLERTGIDRPASSASTTLGSSNGSAAAHRVMLINMQAGTGGLDPQLRTERSSFGVGTGGLGTAQCRAAATDVRVRQLEEWSSGREKWAHEDAQREAARQKKWSAAHRIRTVSDMRTMMYEEEFKRCEAVKDSKEKSKLLSSEAQAAREALTAKEHDAVRELRELAASDAHRRREQNEQHAAALQHLGQLENASRKLSSMNADEEAAARTRKLQRQKNITRAASAEQREAALGAILHHKRQVAEEERKRREIAEKRMSTQHKLRASEMKDYVKGLHQLHAAGPRNARALLEYRNSQRHEASKKEHEALEALVDERREKLISAAKALAEAQRNEERRRREASPLRQFGGRRSPSSSSDGGDSV